MRVVLAFALIILLLNSAAYADIYKCEAGKNKTVYSDKPCTGNSGQKTISITNQSVQSGNSLVVKQLGNAVKNAIRNNDLERAEALASTDEQKAWVAQARAEKTRNAEPKTEAEINAVKSSSDECITAQKDLDELTQKNNPDPTVLAAKTSLMRAKCGIKEPNNVIVNQPPYYSNWPRPMHTHKEKHENKATP